MKRVLAIVGTKGPFPRLVDALARLARETGWQVRVQYAGGTLPEGLVGWPELARHRMLQEIDEADAVICHAGSGTLRDVLAAGHRPIVVPRLARHGEHVNDHQLELTEALAGRVVGIVDGAGEALTRALRDAVGDASRRPPETMPGDALRDALRDELARIAEAPRSLRARSLYAIATRLCPRRIAR